MSWDEPSIATDLNMIPTNWDGFTKEQKVQTLLDFVNEQLRLVRSGGFDPSDGDRVAALALECQFALTDIYADVEASARSAKHYVEFIEHETANAISKIWNNQNDI